MDDARHSAESMPQVAPSRPQAGAGPAAHSRPALAVALLMLIALAHGLIYAFATPVWQAPDEPMVFEYAALAAERGRIPTRTDVSYGVQERIVASLNRQGFWRYLRGADPQPPPVTMGEALSIFYMPRQVGGDPPLYFALVALPLRLTAGWSVEAQVYLLRALNALLLPAGVLCVYLTARELLADAREPSWRLVPMAAAALVALHPMYTYIGAMVNNDGPANAIGALLCLLLVRALRRGLPLRDLALIALVTAVGLQVKRTIVPYALMAAILGAVWLVRLALRGGPGAARRRGAALAAAVGAPALAAALVAGQLEWGRAARWYDARTLDPMGRVADGAGYAMALEPGQEAIQVLPDVATVFLRNGAVRAGARVWGDGPATGRLAVYTGDRRQEYAFAIERLSAAEIGAAIPTTANDVRLGIIADSGRLYVSDIWISGAGLAGNLVSNGDMARPALRPGSALAAAARYLRLEELLWVLESGRYSWGLRSGGWARWAFVSYWGQLGWFQVAAVRDTWLEPALVAMAGAGLAGAALALARGVPARRIVVAALLGLCGLAVAPLLANALVDPLPIQQGRYLFPVAGAVAALLALGQASLLPARARPTWLACWLGFWLLFAGATLLRLVSFYNG